jgi:hypothetical protein
MAKTTKPVIRIHNIEIDEIIDREMTDSEFETYQADLAKLAAQQVEAKAKAVARQEILDRLGLTADEAQLLLG